MKTTDQNPRISLNVPLWAVILHLLCCTGLAQTTNQVLSLDGSDDYVSIPSAPDLQNPTEITVEAWIYPTVTAGNKFGSFINKGDGQTALSARTYELRWFTNGNINMDFFLDHVDGTPDAANVNAPMTASTWTHIAAIFNSDQGIVQLYTNGVLAMEASSLNGSPVQGRRLRQSILPVVLGWTPSFGDTYASGKMDEVRVWKKARTQAEIAGNRFCQLYGGDTNLAGVWNFDDGTANDGTGHGHNGTFAGNAQAVAIGGSDVVHAGVCGATQPHTATASAVLVNDFVVSANLTDGGYGYTNSPAVRIIGGGGSGAQAVAVVSNGVVITVNVFDAGHGYTNPPVIVIAPPFIASPILNIAPMSFLSFSNLTIGGVYQLQRLVEWYWVNQPVNFTATNSTYTQMVSGVMGSGDYRLALNPVPAQAFAVPQVVNGFIVGATVTSGGSGYVTSPPITITGDSGSNATAFASVSGGVVTNITITSAGGGYTNTPTVQIAPPPAAALSPSVQPVMRVDSASLSPYDNYQIEFKPGLGATWQDWSGGLFSPTDVTNSQYLFITNGTGFFRLRYVP